MELELDQLNKRQGGGFEFGVDRLYCVPECSRPSRHKVRESGSPGTIKDSVGLCDHKQSGKLPPQSPPRRPLPRLRGPPNCSPGVQPNLLPLRAASSPADRASSGRKAGRALGDRAGRVGSGAL